MADDFEDLGVNLSLKGAEKATQQANMFTKALEAIDATANNISVSFDKVSGAVRKVVGLFEKLSQKGLTNFGATVGNILGYESTKSNRIDKAMQKTISLQDTTGKDVRTIELLNKAQLKLNDIKISQNKLSSVNRQIETQKLNLLTKQNNALINSKTYANAYRKAQESIVAKKKLEQQIQKDIKNKQNSILKTSQSYSRASIPVAIRNVGDLRTSIEKVDKSTKKVNKSTSSWIKNIAKIGAVAMIARRVGSVLNSLVEASGSWIENLNLFAVTFGRDYRETLDWALEFSNRLGIANNEIVKMTGLFKQLSTAIGITDETGDELSKTLTQLGYDFGSFYNISFETAFSKLQSGIFSGQVKTLRSIGIDVSNESIDNLLRANEALSKFNLTANQLTQSQKVIARVLLTMNAGANAFGDLSRSIDTLQNRVRVFQGSLENLKLAIGDAISEPVRNAMAYLNGFIQAVTIAIRAFVPIKQELSYDIGDNILTEIKEDAEEANTAMGQLSFDKFESLSDGEDENLTITEALTAELKKQSELYEQISSQFDGIDEQVVKIRNNILKWIFPYAEIDEQTGEIIGGTKELNSTIESLVNTFKSVWGIAKDLFDLFHVYSPALLNIVNIILKLVSAFTQVIDQLNLIYPVVIMFIGLKIASKVSGVITALLSLGNAFKNVKAWFENYNLQCALATKKSEIFRQSAAAMGIGLLSLVGAITSLISNWSEMSTAAKALTIVVGALTAVIAAAAAAKYALMGNWAKALSVAGMVVATGATIMTAISGFENGGIPEKSELFYMNEHGVPEALINTGGSQTNVINIDQLSEGMRRGFVAAIMETGLNDIANPTITLGGNINDSALARAIFPALKTESKRQGGNQL